MSPALVLRPTRSVPLVLRKARFGTGDCFYACRTVTTRRSRTEPALRSFESGLHQYTGDGVVMLDSTSVPLDVLADADEGETAPVFLFPEQRVVMAMPFQNLYDRAFQSVLAAMAERGVGDADGERVGRYHLYHGAVKLGAVRDFIDYTAQVAAGRKRAVGYIITHEMLAPPRAGKDESGKFLVTGYQRAPQAYESAYLVRAHADLLAGDADDAGHERRMGVPVAERASVLGAMNSAAVTGTFYIHPDAHSASHIAFQDVTAQCAVAATQPPWQVAKYVRSRTVLTKSSTLILTRATSGAIDVQ